MIATPKRPPVYTNNLTNDEQDCLIGRVNESENQKRSFSTQTEEVLIFTNKDEILSAYDPKGRSLQNLIRWLVAQEASINELKEAVQVLLDILACVRALKDEREMNLSKLINNGLLDFSTPARTEDLPQPINVLEAAPSEEDQHIVWDLNETMEEDNFPEFFQEQVQEQIQEQVQEQLQEQVRFDVIDLPERPAEENVQPEFYAYPVDLNVATEKSLSFNLQCHDGPIVEISYGYMRYGFCSCRN